MRASIIGARAAAVSLIAVLCASCASTPAQKRAQIEVAPTPCADFSFPVYFKERSDALGPAALQVISDSAQQAKACRIESVKVTGLSEAAGAKAAAVALSARRAKVVAQALAANGLPTPTFDVQAVGQDGAVTRNGLFRPVHGRAEVLIHFAGN